MSVAHAVLAVGWVLVGAAAVPAASTLLLDLERALQKAVTTRAGLIQKRSATVTDASVLAAQIATVKSRAGMEARATRELEALLQRFDRMVADLDRNQTAILEQDRSIARLVAAFDKATADATATLGPASNRGDVLRLAAEQREMENARQRVDNLGVRAPGFRSVLHITLAPADTPGDITQKVALLGAERQRVWNELERLDRELTVVSARISLKDQLVEQLQSATRASPSEMRLLEREADIVAKALSDLERQRDALTRDRSGLGRVLADTDQTLEQFRNRRQELLSRRAK